MPIIKKLAVFKDSQFNWEIALECDEHNEYVRITEHVEVEFPDRPAKEVLDGQLANLDALENKVRCELSMKIEDIKRRRAELLCLPAPRAEG